MDNCYIMLFALIVKFVTLVSDNMIVQNGDLSKKLILCRSRREN